MCVDLWISDSLAVVEESKTGSGQLSLQGS